MLCDRQDCFKKKTLGAAEHEGYFLYEKPHTHSAYTGYVIAVFRQTHTHTLHETTPKAHVLKRTNAFALCDPKAPFPSTKRSNNNRSMWVRSFKTKAIQ